MIDKIYWTSQGTIDKERTMKALAVTAELDVEIRFQIAVSSCLKDEINSLAIQLPSDYLDKYAESLGGFEHTDNIFVMDDITTAKQHFGILENNWVDYRKYFKKMLNMRNDLGCHYFWQRLSEQEQINVLTLDAIPCLTSSFMSHNNIVVSNSALFLFTQCDHDKRIQLLQDKYYYLKLMNNLISLRWLSISYKCTKALLELPLAMFASDVLPDILMKSFNTPASGNKYMEIIKLLLQFLCQKYSNVILSSCLNYKIFSALDSLANTGEIMLVKGFLTSVCSEWLQFQFSGNLDNLEYLISAAVECDVLEYVLNIALPTVEDRHKFVINEKLDSLISNLFMLGNEIENIIKFLSYLYFDNTYNEGFKQKLIEKQGFNICRCVLFSKKSKGLTYFTQRFFTSEEETICFYNEFFRSEKFGELLTPYILNEFIVIIDSFIKENGLETLWSNELILNICLTILSRCLHDFFYQDLSYTKTLFEALDIFLLIMHNDQEKFTALKEELISIIIDRQLYLSLLVEFLHNTSQFDFVDRRDNKKYQIWYQMTEDFFNWICPSDEKLKATLKDGFWSSQVVLEAAFKHY